MLFVEASKVTDGFENGFPAASTRAILKVGQTVQAIEKIGLISVWYRISLILARLPDAWPSI